jgi:hypothetical protein
MPEIIHKALRRVAGIDQSPIASSFPLQGPSLPIFV